MTKFVGRRGAFGLRKEASRAAGGVPTFWFPRSTVSFDDKVGTAREEEGMGRIEDSDSLHVTSKMAEGEMEFDLEDRNLGIILTSLLGASPTSTGGPTYTHAYTLQNTNQHQSLAGFYQDPDISSMFPLLMVDSLSIEVEAEGVVRGTVGFKSRRSRDWTSQSVDFTTKGNKFLHQHLQVKLADTIAGLSGATAISLKSMTLNFNANTVFDNVMGTVDPEDILNLQFSVDGTMNLNKEDQTYRNYMLNGTYKAMEYKLLRAANSSLTFQLPRVDFSEWEQDRDLNSIVQQSIDFKANYDFVNALAAVSTAELVNTYAGTNY